MIAERNHTRLSRMFIIFDSGFIYLFFHFYTREETADDVTNCLDGYLSVCVCVCVCV